MLGFLVGTTVQAQEYLNETFDADIPSDWTASSEAVKKNEMTSIDTRVRASATNQNRSMTARTAPMLCQMKRVPISMWTG